jgi:hypothetical protein
VTLGEVQVEGGFFQICMTQENLNGSEIGTSLEQMRGKTVPQRMRMDTFLDVRSLGGVMTRMPNGFRIDGLITTVAVVAGKEPLAGFSPQAVPMGAELFK